MKLLQVLILLFGLDVFAQGTKILRIFCGDYNVIVLQEKFWKKLNFRKLHKYFRLDKKFFCS